MKDACRVHFLDPEGNRSEIWPIGDEGIPADVHEKYKDDKGELYAIVVYKNGEPETSIIEKEIWKEAEQQSELRLAEISEEPKSDRIETK